MALEAALGAQAAREAQAVWEAQAALVTETVLGAAVIVAGAALVAGAAIREFPGTDRKNNLPSGPRHRPLSSFATALKALGLDKFHERPCTPYTPLH